jgi:hypothetical protein
MADRRSGRTSKALAALPDGSIYIVTHEAQRRHCQRLMQDAGRRQQALHIVTLDEMRRGDKLRGLPRTTVLDVDHFVFESGMCSAGSEMREHLRMWQQRYSVPRVNW